MLAWQLFQERGAEGLWQKTVGHLDWSLEETMRVQHRLLDEQLQVLNASPWRSVIFGDRQPQTSHELRQQIGLTTYEDYQATLGQQREELLAAKPLFWLRTSGRSGEGRHKWYPVSHELYEVTSWLSVGMLLLSAASERGQVNVRRGDRLLNMLAPPPYASGTMFGSMTRQWPVTFVPSFTPEVEALSFEQRQALAFRLAVTHGIQFVAGLSSVLAGIGEQFEQRRASAFGRCSPEAAPSHMADGPRSAESEGCWAVDRSKGCMAAAGCHYRRDGLLTVPRPYSRNVGCLPI